MDETQCLQRQTRARRWCNMELQPASPSNEPACSLRTHWCQGPRWGGACSCAPRPLTCRRVVGAHEHDCQYHGWLVPGPALGGAVWCMQEEVVRDDHGSHAAFTLPGKWTLASQECSREFSEWRCSGSESGWSPKGLAAQLEDHTHTPIHTCTLHTWHTYACHTQTTPTYHVSHVCTHNTHTLYVYHIHVHNHVYTITRIPTTDRPQTHTHTYHTNLHVPRVPHITHVHIPHAPDSWTHHTTHTTCMQHTHIPIYITRIHTLTPQSSHIYTTQTLHMYTNCPASYPQHVHICATPHNSLHTTYTPHQYISHIYTCIYTPYHTLTVQTWIHLHTPQKHPPQNAQMYSHHTHENRFPHTTHIPTHYTHTPCIHVLQTYLTHVQRSSHTPHTSHAYSYTNMNTYASSNPPKRHSHIHIPHVCIYIHNTSSRTQHTHPYTHSNNSTPHTHTTQNTHAAYHAVEELGWGSPETNS